MRKLWLIFYFIPILFAEAQVVKPSAIISEPTPGSGELKTVFLWLRVSPEFNSFSLKYWKEGRPHTGGAAMVGCTEINNPYRVPGSPVKERNNTKISLERKKNGSCMFCFMAWTGRIFAAGSIPKNN